MEVWPLPPSLEADAVYCRHEHADGSLQYSRLSYSRDRGACILPRYNVGSSDALLQLSIVRFDSAASERETRLSWPTLVDRQPRQSEVEMPDEQSS